MEPVEIKIKEKKNLFIKWNNGIESNIKLTNLKRACPCASCNKEREEQGSSYIPIYSDNDVKVKDIKLMGAYGLNIIWEDGHTTGIYEFNYLKKLSEIL